jgi:exopolyphosphatase / guanosine-5'-triphosphate,3'-diphosphate pyrophosphatase
MNVTPTRAASIDVGTNTVLLLVADVKGAGQVLRPLIDTETVVRLGEGLQKNRRLSPAAMERALRALKGYIAQCDRLAVEKIFAAGTSALREAENSAEFLKLVKEDLGIEVEVLSGDEEAELSLLSVTKDLPERKRPFYVIDIGGGSTEFILGRGDEVIYRKSFTLGSVRYTEEFLPSDPVRHGEWEKMSAAIRDSLSSLPRPENHPLVVAVGGTATSLASVELGLKEFTPEKIHGFILKKAALKKQLLLYRSKDVHERKGIRGLAPARAEVILAGATILYIGLQQLRSPSVLISCHGWRYGLLYRRLDLG